MKEVLSEEAFLKVLQHHREYLESNGKEGIRLYLDGYLVNSSMVIENTDLTMALFENCHLDISFINCKFVGSDIHRSVISGSFEACDFTEVSFYKTTIADVHFIGNNFIRCTFDETTLTSSVINACSFECTRLYSNTLTNNTFTLTTFRELSRGTSNKVSSNTFKSCTLRLEQGLFSEWSDNIINGGCLINWKSKGMVADILRDTKDINMLSFTYLLEKSKVPFRNLCSHHTYSKAVDKLQEFLGYPGVEELP